MISQQDRESSPPVDRPSVRPRCLKVSERLQGEREVILAHDSQDDRLGKSRPTASSFSPNEGPPPVRAARRRPRLTPWCRLQFGERPPPAVPARAASALAVRPSLPECFAFLDEMR